MGVYKKSSAYSVSPLEERLNNTFKEAVDGMCIIFEKKFEDLKKLREFYKNVKEEDRIQDKQQ
jgi:hypothetical protein